MGRSKSWFFVYLICDTASDNLCRKYGFRIEHLYILVPETLGNGQVKILIFCLKICDTASDNLCRKYSFRIENLYILVPETLGNGQVKILIFGLKICDTASDNSGRKYGRNIVEICPHIVRTCPKIVEICRNCSKSVHTGAVQVQVQWGSGAAMWHAYHKPKLSNLYEA